MDAASLFGQVAWLAGALALVLGLVYFGLGRLLPRLMPGRTGSGTPMRVIQRLALGRQQSLVLVEINGHRLVVGVTEQTIRTIVDNADGREPTPGDRGE